MDGRRDLIVTVHHVATLFLLVLLSQWQCTIALITYVKILQKERKSLLAVGKTSFVEDTSDSTKRLIHWAKTQEVEGIESTTIGWSKATGTRGMYSKESFKAGDYILAIPFPATLVIEDTLDDENQVPVESLLLDPDVIRGYRFLRDFYENPFYEAYISSLPTRNDESFDATPEFWTDNEIAQLQVPDLIQQTLCRKRDIKRLSSQLQGLDYGMLQWATWVIRSRGFTSMTLRSSDSTFALQSRSVLVPYIDMINHDDEPNTLIDVINAPSYEESFYCLQATKPVRAGDHLTVCYGTGRETCLDMLSKYGFWVEGSSADLDINWEAVRLESATSLQEDEELLLVAQGPMKTVLEFRTYLKRLSLQET